MPKITPSNLHLDAQGRHHEQPLAVGAPFPDFAPPRPAHGDMAHQEVRPGVTDNIDDPETPEEARQDPNAGEHRLWQEEIRSGLVSEKRWREEAQGAEEEYFGEDGPMLGMNAKREKGKVNTVHSTIETMKPAVYSQTPEPIVRRRHKDGKKDAIDGIVAEVAQRLGIALIDMTRFDAVMERVRDDWLIAGRSAPRVKYKAEFGEEIDPTTGQPYQVKTSERVDLRTWHWRRVVICPAETWEDVRWIAYENLMTRKEIEAHPNMGPEVAAKISFMIDGLSKTSGHNITDNDENSGHNIWAPMDEAASGSIKDSVRPLAVVYEIWDKQERRVKWWSPHYTEGLIGGTDDPLMLENFFDCPEFLFAARKSGTMQPRPAMAYYIEHVREVDLASKKLQDLLTTISVSGFYAGEKKDEVAKLLTGKNTMVAIKDWIGFAEKGGLNGMVQWLPIDLMVNAAQALITMREQSKQVIFEVTGMSDIVRGASDPRETAAAQKIKGQYAGMRLGMNQRTFALHVREVIRMMIEVAVEHFDIETIKAMVNLTYHDTEQERMEAEQMVAMLEQAAPLVAAFEEAQMAEVPDNAQINDIAMQLIQMGIEPGQPLPPPPEVYETSWEAVHNILKDDLMRSFTVTIETDGTILTEEGDDRDARIEFLTSISGMAEQLTGIAGGLGGDFKMVKELLLFGVRGFRKARTLEQMITSLPDELPEQEEAPDVQLQVAEIRAETDRMVAELKSQTELQVAGIKVEGDLEEQALENEGKVQQEHTRAAQKGQDREHSLRMKGVDLQAEAMRTPTKEAAR